MQSEKKNFIPATNPSHRQIKLTLRLVIQRCYDSSLHNHNRNRPSIMCPHGFISINSFSRKEVIHPHVLVRMPCYDLTPIISPTLGRRGGLRVLVTLMV